MRKLKKWRYYCDFCPKAGMSASCMTTHEKRCTRNPNRVCGMCATAKLTQRPTADLRRLLDEKTPDELFEEIRCPACVMTAIHALRREEPLRMLSEVHDSTNFLEFDFTKAKETFWQDVNEREYAY